MIPAILWARSNWKMVLTRLGFAVLGFMLLLAKADARHWHKLADAEKAAHAQTVANYRAAAVQAELADKANVLRVKDQQAAITEKVSNDYQGKLASAADRYERLRAIAEAYSRRPHDPSVPATGEASIGSDAAPAQDEFSVSDRLIATEQAIQLAALQDWVRQQSAIDTNGESK